MLGALVMVVLVALASNMMRMVIAKKLAGRSHKVGLFPEYRPIEAADIKFSHSFHVSDLNIPCAECHSDKTNPDSILRFGHEVDACQNCHEGLSGLFPSLKEEGAEDSTDIRNWHQGIELDDCGKCH